MCTLNLLTQVGQPGNLQWPYCTSLYSAAALCRLPLLPRVCKPNMVLFELLILPAVLIAFGSVARAVCENRNADE